MMWRYGNKASPLGAALADRHYSRRKVGSPQFMPPGETLVLITNCGRAVWGWWRPHPASGLSSMNGLDGWTCTIFRNEGAGLSSTLILEAELALQLSGRGCGPDGMLTYVAPRKIASTNPGACFMAAGWKKRGTSKDGRKILFWKAFECAGVPRRRNMNSTAEKPAIPGNAVVKAVDVPPATGWKPRAGGATFRREGDG